VRCIFFFRRAEYGICKGLASLFICIYIYVRVKAHVSSFWRLLSIHLYPTPPISTPSFALLPNIREQIIAPAKPTRRLRRRARMRRRRRWRTRRWRRTAPPAKVVILRNLRGTPSRALRRGVRCRRRGCGLAGCRRAPDVVAAPGVHVREAAAVVDLRGRGLGLGR
jgi:hypothetical protein